ncbi:MAG: prohibitin family protein [Bacteroidaceae bacterium]|nr:prohibitin family protein [Bacteroidaceae bacterium]
MNTNTKIIILIAAIVAIFALALGSFTCVEPTEVGVVKTKGSISGTIPRGNGYTFKIPFIQSITTIPLDPQKDDFTYEVGDDGAITKDMQTVGVSTSIIYVFNEDEAENFVRNYTRSSMESFFKSNMKTSLKVVIGKYSIYDLTKETDKIAEEVKKLMEKKCAKFPITIQDVNISNWDWTGDFDNQIKETMIKTQKEKTAKADVEIEKANNEKKVVAARAQLQADSATYLNALNKAQNELEIAKKKAEAVVVAAKAEAEAMIAKNKAIAANYAIQQSAWKHEETMARLEKWNGKMPGADANTITPNFSGINMSKVE